MSLVFPMSAVGALVAGVAGAFGANLTAQVIVFVAMSIALLIVLHPFPKGRIDRSSGYVPSDIDSLIDKTGYVTGAAGECHRRIQLSGGE